MQTGVPGYRCVRTADTYERDSMLLRESHRLERSSEPTSSAHAWLNTLLAVLALLVASLSALQQPPFVPRKVGPGEIADGAMSRYSLGDGAVTRDKLADGAVAGSVLAAGGVGSAAIASDAVTRRALAEGSVGALQLEERAVRSSHLADGAVLARALAEGAVTREALSHGAVGAAHLSADLLRVLSQTVHNASSRGSTCGAGPRGCCGAGVGRERRGEGAVVPRDIHGRPMHCSSRVWPTLPISLPWLLIFGIPLLVPMVSP